MDATVADIKPKSIEGAKRQFVELYGSALVLNTYLKIALVYLRVRRLQPRIHAPMAEACQ